MTSAILFDAFGTVIDIKRRFHPYRMLLRLGMQQGLRFGPDALRQLMVFNGSMIGAADLLGIRVPAQALEAIQDALEEELTSCVPIPDAIEAIEMLKAARKAESWALSWTLRLLGRQAEEGGHALHRAPAGASPSLRSVGCSLKPLC